MRLSISTISSNNVRTVFFLKYGYQGRIILRLLLRLILRIVLHLVSRIPGSGQINKSTGIGTYSDFMKNSVTNTIHLNDADAGEIYSIIKNFKNKSKRDTKISAFKIANESYVFTNALAGVINKSLRQGIFPDELKITRVISIYKAGPKTDVSNSRPILLLLLGSFYKIYEKIMHVRLINFFDSNNSLFDSQYGF